MKIIFYGVIGLLFINAIRKTKKKKGRACCGGGCADCPLNKTKD